MNTVVNALERTITVSVPYADIDADIASRLQRLQRTVKLQGFRPGKVPLKMVERYYGYQVRQEAVSDQVERQFTQAVRSANYRVAGLPRFDPIEPPAGTTPANLEFNATFEVYPEVALGDLSGEKISKPITSVEEADVDRTVETLRKQRAAFEPAERAAATGDFVNVDFVGTLDGVAFEGGSGTNFGVVLGEGRMLPDFEAGVIGMKPGDQKTFPVNFPADYQAENLRGKTAQFSVTMNQVNQPKLPAVDAAFAKALGVADGDIAQLRKEIRENLEREAKKRVQTNIRDQVMEALIKVNPLQVPRALVEAEIGRSREAAMEDLKSRGMTTKNMELPADLFSDRAERRVRLGLIVAEVVRQNNLKPDARAVRSLIEEHAQSFEKPEELVRWYYTQPDRVAEVEALALENAVVDWCMGKMKVEDQVVPFKDLMGISA